MSEAVRSERRPPAAPYCAAAAAAMSIAAIAVFFVPPAPTSTPARVPQLLTWVEDHPADWFAYTRLTETALESNAADPHALWSASFEASRALATARKEPNTAFVSSGFFHWGELNPRERERVLTVTAPLLRDPEFFGRVSEPLFRMTGDLHYLERNGPGDIASLTWLETLAGTSGMFDDYRALRAKVQRARMARLDDIDGNTSAAALLDLLPQPLRASDELLLRKVLEHFRAHPVDLDPGRPDKMDQVIDYAIRHRVEPLEGIEAVVDIHTAASDVARARLALRFHRAREASSIETTSSSGERRAWIAYYIERAAFEREAGHPDVASVYLARASASAEPPSWRGLCESMYVCTTASAAIPTFSPSRAVSFLISPADSRDTYFELYVDDTLVAEGVAEAQRTLTFTLPEAELHPVELRIVNPFTPRGDQRRLRVAAPAVSL